MEHFSPNSTQTEKIAHYRRVARAYVEAVNAGDVEAVLACYADDAEVHDPLGQRDFRGKAALREFYEAVAKRGAKMEIVGPICGSFSAAVATPIRSRVPGLEVDCITISEFDDDGLVRNYSAYYGPTDIHPTG